MARSPRPRAAREPLPARAQESGAAGLEIGEARPLPEGELGFGQVETVAAVDPTDGERMIAAAMAVSPRHDGIAVYLSRDGGHSWELVEGPDGAVFPGGDSTLAFDAGGRAYLASLASGLTIWRSDDRGRAWERVEEKEETYDRPWTAASKMSGEDLPPVYAAGRAGTEAHALAVHASHDLGGSFRELLRVRIPLAERRGHAGPGPSCERGLPGRLDGARPGRGTALFGPISSAPPRISPPARKGCAVAGIPSTHPPGRSARSRAGADPATSR